MCPVAGTAVSNDVATAAFHKSRRQTPGIGTKIEIGGLCIGPTLSCREKIKRNVPDPAKVTFARKQSSQYTAELERRDLASGAGARSLLKNAPKQRARRKVLCPFHCAAQGIVYRACYESFFNKFLERISSYRYALEPLLFTRLGNPL
jgi:hypothetical protein